ncbi:putative glycolipid-binding domain-containing protein [Microbacterium sp.]|uniref:putative glycolipid-binding domain-containing protein n=1 Tax=Microbacterium sp. TaxID=51671 RepID=UPI002810AF00|nr:putative glycolipid-binding domain-containing protein [Microbacterium sp.]
MTSIVWNGIESRTQETCEIHVDEGGVHVRSAIRDGGILCSYTLRATHDWIFTDIAVRVGERVLDVRRTADGWKVAGLSRDDLREAHEVDISASPLSNTLPIRRLRLAVGESADITTAYIRVPGLDVMADPQRYTRLSANEYLYESRDSDFRRTLTVDDEGLVIDYPGLFARAAQ